jgi:uncharacterized protein YijF (DUF1287 family)
MQNAMSRRGVFHPGDLVIWRGPHGRHAIPIAAVVIRQEADGVVIKARVEGMIKELCVDSEQLIER